MEEIAIAVVTSVQVGFICKAQNPRERLSGAATLKSGAARDTDGTSTFQARLA